MRWSKSRRVAVVLGGLVALAASPAALAENVPHPKLDEIASEVAGPGKTVWCENDEAAWHATPHWQPGLAGFVVFWSRDGGQSWTPESVAHLAPAACLPLHAALAGGYEAVPLAQLAVAILVLVHESVHLFGVRDEGATDCEALRRIEDVAVRHFGVPPTISITDTVYRTVTRHKYVYRWKRVPRSRMVNGERVRVLSRVRVRVRVPHNQRVAEQITREERNPALDALVAAATAAHRSAPPEYQGSC